MFYAKYAPREYEEYKDIIEDPKINHIDIILKKNLYCIFRYGFHSKGARDKWLCVQDEMTPFLKKIPDNPTVNHIAKYWNLKNKNLVHIEDKEYEIYEYVDIR